MLGRLGGAVTQGSAKPRRRVQLPQVPPKFYNGKRYGRITVELDHINGDHYDNRIENLRILCPNCHSLQPTHRGRNKKIRLVKMRLSAGAGMVDSADLKSAA
jgi:5-methylcytosine-specific restriction endonuclease McrA